MYSLPRSSQIFQPWPLLMMGTEWPSPPSLRSSKTEWRVKCIHRWSRAASEWRVPAGVRRSEVGSQTSFGLMLIVYPSCRAVC